MSRSIGSDDRARVPFALVGVLLLVGSSMITFSLATPGAAPVDRTADAVADRVDAETTAALRGAIRRAAHAAAREPVTIPAESAAGRALGTTAPFRRALELRIYLQARKALMNVEHQRGRSAAHVTLPQHDDIDTLLTQVSVTGVDDGTELQATIRGIQLTVMRDNRIIDTRIINRTMTVAVPVLALHDQTVKFQRRLDADALTGPGLARRTTIGLNAITQARGLGQYAGAPIGNVLSNSHVTLSTNAGLVDSQRAVFGRSDPDAAAGLRVATLNTGINDVLTPLTPPRVAAAVTGAVPGPNAPERLRVRQTKSKYPDPVPSAEQTITVGVNGTADSAFLAVLRGTDTTASYEQISQTGYTAWAQLMTDVDVQWQGRPTAPDSPGPNWTLAETDVSREVTVMPASPTRVSHRFRDGIGRQTISIAARSVTVDSTVKWTWQTPEKSPRITTDSWRQRSHVQIHLTGRVVPLAVPTRGIFPSFEPGGAINGPNLVETTEAAQKLLRDNGGYDDIARRAAVNGDVTAIQTVSGRRPPSLSTWVYEDVSSLREKVRTISVVVSGDDIATGQTNPAARLTNSLQRQRYALIDPPRRYDGVADRVRVATRAAYIDTVIAHLEQRSEQTAKQNAGITDVLDVPGISASRINKLAGLTPMAPPPRRTLGTAGGVSGPLSVIPDGDPAYLGVSPVNATLVDGITDETSYIPLAARNQNVFAIPYADAADTVVSQIFGAGGRVSLQTAGQALIAADNRLAVAPDATLRTRRNTLEAAITDSMEDVEQQADRTLRSETDLSNSARTAAIDETIAMWDSGSVALAAANGSLATALATRALARGASAQAYGHERDQLETALRVDLRKVATSKSVRVPEPAVDDTMSSLQQGAHSVASAAAANATERAVTRATKGTVTTIPAGLPVLPTFSPWIATVNLWIVDIRGGYGRFAVGTASGSMRYIRDGSTVSLDIDADGTAETLGRNERIDFTVRTAAIVVVPSGPFGVGDVDGNADERSVGWTGAGADARCTTPTGYCPRE